MQTQTLERKYSVLDKEIPEKKGSDFSMEDYLDFAEKFPSKPKLAKEWVALFLLISEATQKEKELKEVQQETSNKHRFNIGGELYEIEVEKGIPKRIPEKYNKESLNSLFNIPYKMTSINGPTMYESERDLEGKVERISQIKTTESQTEELITPWQFLRRMYLIAYACFKYPFSKGDVYVDYETGQIIHERDLRK